MVHGLPNISSTNGVCEGCVLGKHHREMFDKGKAWRVFVPEIVLRLQENKPTQSQ